MKFKDFVFGVIILGSLATALIPTCSASTERWKLFGSEEKWKMIEPSELSTDVQQQVAYRTAEFCQNKVIDKSPLPPDPVSSSFVPVLLYHRVTDVDRPSRDVTSPAMFEEHLQMIQRLGYNTITAHQLTEYMLGKSKIPEKSVLLTFDDGWKDNLVVAEKLAKYNFSGTFYVISGFFGNSKYLNELDVLKLSKNMKFEIGAHTHTHFIKFQTKLHELDNCTMATEMVSSKLILEQLIKQPVRSFAWPYGYNTIEGLHIAADIGYTSTMLVNRYSRNVSGASPLGVRRLNIDGSCPLADFQQMLQDGNLKECSK